MHNGRMLPGLRACALLLFAAAFSELAILAARPSGRIGAGPLLLCLLALALQGGLGAIVFRGALKGGDPLARRAAKAAFLLNLLAGAGLALAAIRGALAAGS